MFGTQTSEDYQPVGWIGRYPIHMTTLLVIVHVLTMVATAIAMATGNGAWVFDTFTYDSRAIFQRFAFWQFGTYAFVHSPNQGFWFLIEMYLLFAFGREVERFIGRKAFLSLYVLLLFLPPCLLTALGPLVPSRLQGSGILNFCVFLAFATLYPNVQLLFGLVVKWVAAALLALYTLQKMAANDWTGLIVLQASAALAFCGIRRLRGEPILGGLRMPGLEKGRFGGSPASKVVPMKRPKPGPKKKDVTTPENVDAILDKISRQGIGSLTAKERATLERASKHLLSKEKRD